MKLLYKNNIYLIFFFAIVMTATTYTAYRRSTPKYPPPAICQDFGIYLGQNLDDKVLSELANLHGSKPGFILTFIGWSDNPFDTNLKELKRIVNKAYKPVITLEPWYSPSQKPVNLEDIINGKEDEVIIKFADNILELIKFSEETSKVDIYIRFAHEMNGDWYPWSGAQNKNNTELYKKAYIRVYNLINEKIENYTKNYLSKQNPTVKFIWSINANDIPNRSWNSALNYYPGDKYVDVIGIDAYNWSHKKSWFTRWKSFKRIFKKPINKLLKLNKPIYITETASAGPKKETPSTTNDKAKWTEDFFKQLGGEFNFIPVFIWFDVDKEKDWRIMSDDQSKEAFKEGLKKLNKCKN